MSPSKDRLSSPDLTLTEDVSELDMTDADEVSRRTTTGYALLDRQTGVTTDRPVAEHQEAMEDLLAAAQQQETQALEMASTIKHVRSQLVKMQQLGVKLPTIMRVELLQNVAMQDHSEEIGKIFGLLSEMVSLTKVNGQDIKQGLRAPRVPKVPELAEEICPPPSARPDPRSDEADFSDVGDELDLPTSQKR